MASVTPATLSVTSTVAVLPTRTSTPYSLLSNPWAATRSLYLPGLGLGKRQTPEDPVGYGPASWIRPCPLSVTEALGRVAPSSVRTAPSTWPRVLTSAHRGPAAPPTPGRQKGQQPPSRAP